MAKRLDSAPPSPIAVLGTAYGAMIVRDPHLAWAGYQYLFAAAVITVIYAARARGK